MVLFSKPKIKKKKVSICVRESYDFLQPSNATSKTDRIRQSTILIPFFKGEMASIFSLGTLRALVSM